MTDLADIDHVYGQDLTVTPTGDLALATKKDRTIQRIIRRLLTVPTSPRNGSAYPWRPKYGVGLGARIGDALDIRGIEADVRSQMLVEPTVQKVPAPKISVVPLGTIGATINIVYVDLSGVPQSFSFDLVGDPPAPPP
jgi:hypothetical protein